MDVILCFCRLQDSLSVRHESIGLIKMKVIRLDPEIVKPAYVAAVVQHVF